MLKCRDVPEIATDFIEGELRWRDRMRMRLHLLVCRMCRIYLNQIRQTRDFLSRQSLPPPPPEVEERLVSTIPHPPSS